jgi:hypothetical protein
MINNFIKKNWEFFYLLIQIIGLLYIGFFFLKNYYLPNPFVLDKSNTFMDFYNPMSWIYGADLYEKTKTIYPPLNFILLKIVGYFFSIFGINSNSAEVLRAESKLFQIILVVTYLLIAYSSSLKTSSNKLLNFKTLCFAISMTISIPVLFAIERGNILFFSLFLFAIYAAKEEKNSVQSLILLGLLINIKPYFALFSLLYISNFKKLISLVLITGMIFLVSGMIIDQHFYKLFENLIYFNKIGGGIPEIDLLTLPSSVLALKGLIKLIPWTKNYIFWFSLLKFILYLTIILLVINILLNKKITSNEKFVGITLIITNYSITSGGYSFIYYLPIIPLIISFNHKFMIYVLLIFSPIDMINIYRMEHNESIYSYLGSIIYDQSSDHSVILYQEIYLGSLIRPVINLCLLISVTHYLYSKRGKV